MAQLAHTGEIVGLTIQSAEMIRGEFGRTYGSYLCIVFTNGDKAMMVIETRSVKGDFTPYNPNPELNEMRKAPSYFSPEDISKTVLNIEKTKRARTKRLREADERQYEALRKKLKKGD